LREGAKIPVSYKSGAANGVGSMGPLKDPCRGAGGRAPGSFWVWAFKHGLWELSLHLISIYFGCYSSVRRRDLGGLVRNAKTSWNWLYMARFLIQS